MGEDIHAHREVAVKVQTDPAKHQEIHNEAEIYQLLKSTTGFPTYYGAGCDSDRHYIVLELLGKPVSALLREHDRKFTLKTCLMLIDQMLVRMEYIHDKGYIHRDIKPANFLMGMGSKSNTVHLIDFGPGARYLDSHGVHIRGNNWQDFVGTPIFASVNSMSGDCVSRRDDMQSLGYVFIYMMCGTLPWRDGWDRREGAVQCDAGIQDGDERGQAVRVSPRRVCKVHESRAGSRVRGEAGLRWISTDVP